MSRMRAPSSSGRREKGYGRSAGLLTTCLVGLALLDGCTSSGVGSELARVPAAQPLRTSGADTALQLPKDKAFSIRLPSATKEAGLVGEADADANAKEDGNATAWARVSKGGKATGAFQLGHVLANDTGRQMDLTIDVDFDYSYEMKARPEPTAEAATVDLMLYVRDGRNRLVREFRFGQHSTANGSARRSSSERLSFEITLGPDNTASVFVFGQTQVATGDERGGEARLEVTNMTMRVRSELAPAVQAGTAP